MVSQNYIIETARNAATASYSPYSKFRVGAAVLAGGELFQGCNVENASLGLTVCAERVAIFFAIAAGHRRIDAIAVSCIDVPPDSPFVWRMPCGACRQVMTEFGGQDLVIYVDGVGEFTLGDLIPEAFALGNPEHLRQVR